MRKLKWYVLFFTIAITGKSFGQEPPAFFIITTDGFRWQEVFRGMDTSIANDPKFNQGDSLTIYNKYWDTDLNRRRVKLLPFLWTTMKDKGRIYGNKDAGANVKVKNRYWFSYPGYNEIFTGYPDTAVNSNGYPPNQNENILEAINKKPGYRECVVAFGAWDAFDRILNEKRSGFPVINGFDTLPHDIENAALLNKMLRESYQPWKEECLDVYTHNFAMSWLKSRKPKVMYISYGETDEWAHAGQYLNYLDAAHRFDDYVKQIWEWAQNTPGYKNNSYILITCDHGRGEKVKSEWTDHWEKVEGSDDIWFVIAGPKLPQAGEMKNQPLIYQQQFAQTIARLLKLEFKPTHPTGEPILFR